MIVLVIGALAGIVFGSIFLGYKGWFLGALLGGLTGLVLQQIKKMGALESAVKHLTDEQLKTNQQLALLKKNLQTPGTDTNINPIPAPVVKKPLADVINESLGPLSSAQATISSTQTTTSHITPKPPAAESFDLDLPDLEPPKPVRSVVVPPVKMPPVVMPPEVPREPDLGDKISAAVRGFLARSNPIVLIGMAIMFIGVSFLVKYASSQGLFPIEFRLTGVVLGAIALLVVGWKTRTRIGAYGLVLQGGGIAIIYLTLFAAAKMYGLIPLGIAFGLLFIVVILGVLLALLQNAQVLAILATAGGFLAPILTSTGEGSHVGLFSFYLILNLGILAIALYKAWRLLNWVGFMFTFVITAAWGVLKYEPIFYATTQPFLIAFFALYLTVAILFSFKQPTNLKGMVDGSLIFGLPLVGFGLQTTLLKHTEYGLAISAVVLAAIYIALSLGLARRHLQTHRVLIESFLALGISFATLAVPLALDASWTSVTWALEATGLVWVGLRQNRLRPRVVGYLLHVAAAVSLVIFEGLDTGRTPLLSGDFLGLMLLALTSFTIAYLLHYFNESLRAGEKIISSIAIGFGLIWWFVAGFNEMNTHVMGEHHFAAMMLFTALSAILVMLISKTLAWESLGASVFYLLPFILIFTAVFFVVNEYGFHPAQGFGLISIALLLATQYRFLFNTELARNTSSVATNSHLLSAWHILTAWWLFGLIFWEVSWQQENLNLHGTSGAMIWFAAIVIPVIALIGAGQKKHWPFITFERDYKNWVPAPLLLLATLWFFVVCYKTVSNTAHYLPVLNPLDLAQFAIILVFAYAAKREFMSALSFMTNSVRAGCLGIMLFTWVNIVTLRAMSHYQQIEYDFDYLWDAPQIQMALSILWSVCALLVMNLSRRLQLRELWIIGAGLLALVVAKLALKDLSGADTLAGIISFVVVGGLILLIGFLSPIPPKRSTNETNMDSNESVNSNDGVKGSVNE